jgi:ATP-dependent 26S proteasome regulatory subunit
MYLVAQMRDRTTILVTSRSLGLPLPDAWGRQRLFELYARGLTLRGDHFAALVRRTEGVSGAFIRELMRRAALDAINRDGQIVVEDCHLDEALRESAVDGGPFTRSFLGYRPP